MYIELKTDTVHDVCGLVTAISDNDVSVNESLQSDLCIVDEGRCQYRCRNDHPRRCCVRA